MSNKNAKNTMNGTDVFVVAPSNMGKGLAYNESVKQYEVNAQDANGVKLNPDGTVGVALSKDTGNVLELRDDGLYYGASPTVNQIYVSLQGNDANAGTRDAPVQTLNRAYEIISAQSTQGWYNIYLKAGQTFAESANRFWLDKGKNLNYFHYDDPVFGDTVRGNGFFPDCYKELSRPTIICDSFRDGAFVRWGGLQTSIDNIVNFFGVNTVINTSAGRVTGGPYRYYLTSMQHTGDITLNGELGLGSMSIVNLCNNVITNNGSAKPFINDLTPNIQNMVWVWENQVHTYNGMTGTGRIGNVKQVLKPENTVENTAFDRNTKTLFGFGVNWDIFA